MPHEPGCSGRTAHRRLRAWEEAGIWDRLHADLLRLLRQAGKRDAELIVINGVYVRLQVEDQQTGPEVDKRLESDPVVVERLFANPTPGVL